MDGRKTQVVLLDERKIELVVQSRMQTQALLHIVCNYFNLSENSYFGLAFQDDSGHYLFLQNDCKVLDHEYPAKYRTGVLILYFLVKLYPEHISHLQDSVTYELIFLQTRSLIFRGFITVDGATAYKLAALALQASYGDYYDDDLTKENLKKLPVLPRSVFREHPTLAYSEERVIIEHKQLIGRLRGVCIVEYLQIAQTLPTYGVHLYRVRDNKTNAPAILGLSAQGVSQYISVNPTTTTSCMSADNVNISSTGIRDDYAGRKERCKFFGWKQLENLYYREKKFSIEVRDPRRIMQTNNSNTQTLDADAANNGVGTADAQLADAARDPTTHVSCSRRTFGPQCVTVHSWHTQHPLLTKNLWQMAIAQHQFFLECKHRRQQCKQLMLPPSAGGGADGSGAQAIAATFQPQDLNYIAARLNHHHSSAASSYRNHQQQQQTAAATTSSSSSSHGGGGLSLFQRLSSSSGSNNLLKPSTSHTSLNTAATSNSTTTTTTGAGNAALEQQQKQHITRSFSTVTAPPAISTHRNNSISNDAESSASAALNISSSHSTTTTGTGTAAVCSTLDESGSAQTLRDRIEILKTRRMALDDALYSKTLVLKSLCVQEAELTGALPAETPLEPNEQLPAFKKRIGTAFNLSGSKLERFMSSSSQNPSNTPALIEKRPHNNNSNNVNGSSSNYNSAAAAADAAENILAELELRQELQRQIVHAAQVLANDTSVTSKKIRKQRKQILDGEQQKLLDVDRQLHELKLPTSTTHSSISVPPAATTTVGAAAASGAQRVVGRRLFAQLHQSNQQQQQQQQQDALKRANNGSRIAVGGAPPLIVSRQISTSGPSKSIARQGSLQIQTSTTTTTSSATTTRKAITNAAVAGSPCADLSSISMSSVINAAAATSAVDVVGKLDDETNSLSMQSLSLRRCSEGSATLLRTASTTFSTTNFLQRRASKASIETNNSSSVVSSASRDADTISTNNKIQFISNGIAPTTTTTMQQPASSSSSLRKSQSQGALHTIAASQHEAKPRMLAEHLTLLERSSSPPAAWPHSSSVGNNNADTASIDSDSTTNSNNFKQQNFYNVHNNSSAVPAATGKHHQRQLSKVSEVGDVVTEVNFAAAQQQQPLSSSQQQGFLSPVIAKGKHDYDNVEDAEEEEDLEGHRFARATSGARRQQQMPNNIDNKSNNDNQSLLCEQARASMRVLSSSLTPSSPSASASPMMLPTTMSTSTAATAVPSVDERKTSKVDAEVFMHSFNNNNSGIMRAMPGAANSSCTTTINPALSASAHKRRPVALRSDAVSLLDNETASCILNAVCFPLSLSPSRAVVVDDSGGAGGDAGRLVMNNNNRQRCSDSSTGTASSLMPKSQNITGGTNDGENNKPTNDKSKMFASGESGKKQQRQIRQQQQALVTNSQGSMQPPSHAPIRSWCSHYDRHQQHIGAAAAKGGVSNNMQRHHPQNQQQQQQAALRQAAPLPPSPAGVVGVGERNNKDDGTRPVVQKSASANLMFAFGTSSAAASGAAASAAATTPAKVPAMSASEAEAVPSAASPQPPPLPTKRSEHNNRHRHRVSAAAVVAGQHQQAAENGGRIVMSARGRSAVDSNHRNAQQTLQQPRSVVGVPLA